MGKINVALMIENGKCKAAYEAKKAGVEDITLALAQIELMKERVLDDFKKFSAKKER